MKSPTLFALGLWFAFNSFAAPPSDYEAIKAEAEKSYADGSFAKAHELYLSANPTNLPSAAQRWVKFRLADTQWRSQSATETADTTSLDEVRHQLEILVRDVAREEDHDRTWAEVQESLGDFFWTRRNQQNWGEAWPRYQQALDWWAGARDIERARQRYLSIVWRMTRPPGVGRYDYAYWGNNVPLEILDNALKIAQTDGDRARAHLLIAMTLRGQGGAWEQLARVPQEFEAAINLGRKTDWYDGALFEYAGWMAGQGRVVPLENGGWRSEPDYAKALELFRRLTTEFQKGETRYWEAAQQQIRNITDPQLSVNVGNIFLPGSEIQYHLNWRNVGLIDLALYPVELNHDVKLPAEHDNAGEWLSSIDLTGREKIKSWTLDPHSAPDRDKGRVELPLGQDARQRAPAERADDYQPGNEALRLDGGLKPGAYVLEARGAGKSARELILVTDAAVVLKTSGHQALVYVCSALNGAPMAGAEITVWESWWDDHRWHSRAVEKKADTNGIAVVDLEQRRNRQREIFASAVSGDRQAFSLANSYAYDRGFEPWKIYAFTDRPAYRPNETVNWKFIGRRYDGSLYSTPSDQVVEFEITDPRGAKVKSDKVALNAFGSAWGSLDLTAQMPLGEYRIAFWDEGRKNEIGGATLFRLEEYKLPEFKVTVNTPDEGGPGSSPATAPRKKTFRPGDNVEVTIQADYYFGGPVPDANVEVLVHQHPYWQRWHEPRPFPWLYEDMDNGNSPLGLGGRWYGGDQVIKREVLKTDATGRATLTFDTPANGNQDFEYSIEAQVTDASRREISGSGTVRVTRQPYFVYPQPGHNLYRPQDRVEVNFKALDANEQPVRAEGTVKVTRDYWFEIWVAPDGHEVKGAELKRLRAQRAIWPPPPARPDQKDWRLKFQGYEHNDILTRTLKTDTNGEAELNFTPEREGYYRVAWTSEDGIANRQSPIANPIQAETTVWVANNATTELGYRQGAVEIIADKDTFRVGQKAPVMLVAPAGGRYVLFSVEGEDLYSYQLIHMEGTVKLLELPVEEKHVPNVFLSAALVSDRQIFTDTKQIVVPPTRNFLTVDVKPDRAQYQPRDEGTFTIMTKDDAGNPVSAEVALGLVDESVFYIQNDYAGDPRQFYFGSKRAQQVETRSTMSQRNYIKRVQGAKDALIDESAPEDSKGAQQSLGEEVRTMGMGGGGGGGGGGMFADSLVAGKANGLFLAPRNAPRGVTPVGGLAGNFAELHAPASGEPAEKEPAVTVRSDFRSTVFWQPDVITDKEGSAVVKVKYPESLTSWKATVRAVTEGNQFGIADATVRTKQPLIVRLEAPRFFVVGDQVTISAVVNNNTEAPADVKVALDVTNVAAGSLAEGSGGILVPVSALRNAAQPASWEPVLLRIPANSEARADWTVEVKSPGDVSLKVTGRGNEHADAMAKTFVAYEHGIEKFIAKSGKTRLVASKQREDGGNDITVKLELPKDRKPGSTTLTVQITPSMAVTMLDALPYLIDYPYGCTEQTMSRFLPAAITAKTLRDLGLKPEDVMGRVFGGIEPAGAAATHPKGKKDLQELDAIEKAGLERLYDFQHADGGWGWWKEGESDPWMTAYVVWGLELARSADVSVKHGAINRAVSFLDRSLVEEEQDPDMQAWMLHALIAHSHGVNVSKFENRAFENLWARRDELNAYTRALLALSAQYLGKTNEARILVENLENGVKRDDRPDASVLIDGGNIQHSTFNIQHPVIGTAHWGEDGIYGRWSEGGVEATAFALRALLAVDPQNKLIEPVTNWLIKNRRGAQWNNTRDTAIVVLALNDYLRASGELKTDAEFEVIVNGVSIAKKKISGADVFDAPSRFAIDPKLIRDDNEIRIHLKPVGRASVGRASPQADEDAARQEPRPTTEREPALYFSVEAKFFSTEEPIAPAGNEIFVKREYSKLVGRPTLLKGYTYDRLPLRDGDSVKSGERVETVLTIEAKNNYEYLLFEDLKPAGLEAVEVRSGESLFAKELLGGAVQRKFGNTTDSRAAARPPARRSETGNRVSETDYTGRSRRVHEELRDRKVALFIDKLPEGVWEIRYDLRAEAPGQFHALPVVGQAMYVPEIRCNSAEIRIEVEDAP